MTDTLPAPGGTLDRTLHETAHYPQHPPRSATPLYQRNHHQMVVVEDLPCSVCGVQNSTLSDPSVNIWGAKQMETHHKHIEDSLALAISLERFNAVLVPLLLKETGNQVKYGHAFTQDEMEEWIHGDRDNLEVLDDVHHRHVFVGVHTITEPIFRVQQLIVDGFDLTGYHAHSPQEARALTALPNTTGKAKAPRRSKVKAN